MDCLRPSFCKCTYKLSITSINKAANVLESLGTQELRNQALTTQNFSLLRYEHFNLYTHAHTKKYKCKLLREK